MFRFYSLFIKKKLTRLLLKDAIERRLIYRFKENHD